jgi:FkbM family methyltransferase
VGSIQYEIYDELFNYFGQTPLFMSYSGIGRRLREFYEYKVKSTRDLLLQGELGFLLGGIIEEVTGRNPYFWYRQKAGKDRFVTRSVRDHEMWIDLYDRGLSRHLFIRGVHEREATEAYRDALLNLRGTVDEKITVLEVGANIGYYVLEEAQVLGNTASIIAFEPDPQNQELLERNVAHNGYTDQVELSTKAVDTTSGERTFHRSTHSNWNRLEQDDETGNVDQLVDSYPVETTNLDDFLFEREIDPNAVGALRMDLEAHELHVLEGMDEILQADEPMVLFVEFHPAFVGRESYESAISMLESHGFEITFADRSLEVLDIDSFDRLRSVHGSHVRVIFSR